MATLANWYIEAGAVHWWKNEAGGTSKGRDHLGREGNFAHHSVKIVSWSYYPGDFFRFNGADGKRYDAAYSTHYANPRWPGQCVSSVQQVFEQLAGFPKV